MIWPQTYNPAGRGWLSTLVAALPVAVLLGSIALLRIRIHFAALLGLGVSLAIALGVYHMPVRAAAASALYGAGYGLFPIGWIILNILFLYNLTVKKGRFEVLRNSLATLAPDPRLQLILIAFCFGAFIEGIAGFGAPVAITGALLIQLGFKPLQASALSLIANTAPVAFGSLGIPITTLSTVTGMDVLALSKMVGRQLPFFSVIIPFWVVAAYAGFRGALGVWPAAVTAGVAFAVPQFLISNCHGPWLVDIGSASCSIAALTLLLRVWRPKEIWQNGAAPTECDRPRSQQCSPANTLSIHSQPGAASDSAATEDGRTPLTLPCYTRGEIMQAWLPWLVLCAFVFVWALPQTKVFLNGVSNPKLEVPGLHLLVQRIPPVAPAGAAPEKAIFDWNWLSATGTGILLTALLVGGLMRMSPRVLAVTYGETLWKTRFSMLTIAGMLAIGYLTKYSGIDATMGLALAQTGTLYPFFGTLLGWLGVALTGSDTASNVLFGSLQKITAERVHLSPILMGAANSSGGVMGKMVDAQSIVVASTATNWYGHEGDILRYVFFHSLALAALMGLFVYLQAYVAPFSAMVIR